MEINATLLGQAITFALLVLFTMKFVWPPLNDILEERARKIADGLGAAERGQQELKEAKLKVEQELKLVQIRAAEVISNAEKMSQQIIEGAKLQAKAEAQKIIDNARMQIDTETIKVREQLRIQLASLVMDATTQILKSEIDLSRHEKILEHVKEELR